MIKTTQITQGKSIMTEVYFSKHPHYEEFAVILKHISYSRKQ